MVEAIEKLIGSSYMLGLIHAEEENPDHKINAADETEIPAIPFNEAMQFLKSKVPMSKTEWLELEPKLRFRAFTVANISSLDMIESMKHVLIGALEKGESYSETWETMKNILDDDVMKIRPGLWENIFRTNTQTAYIAGKLQQYENSNVAAYQLMVIEDGRTSKICRHLLTASGYGMIISVDHPFWKKYGFPPYHFQCRTSIRAIWPSQVGKLGNMVENPTIKSLSKFKVQEGFGGNPLDKESWWRMTASMLNRIAEYNLAEDVLSFAKQNGIADNFKVLVDDKWVEDEGVIISSKRFEDGLKSAKVYKNDLYIAKQLARISEEPVYLIPERNEGKNSDTIFKGAYCEMKFVHGGRRAIKDNVFEGLKQAKNVYCFVERNFSAESCFSAIHGELLERQRKGDPTPDKSCIVYIITEGKLYTKRLGELF